MPDSQQLQSSFRGWKRGHCTDVLFGNDRVLVIEHWHNRARNEAPMEQLLCWAKTVIPAVYNFLFFRRCRLAVLYIGKERITEQEAKRRFTTPKPTKKNAPPRSSPSPSASVDDTEQYAQNKYNNNTGGKGGVASMASLDDLSYSPSPRADGDDNNGEDGDDSTVITPKRPHEKRKDDNGERDASQQSSSEYASKARRAHQVIASLQSDSGAPGGFESCPLRATLSRLKEIRNNTDSPSDVAGVETNNKMPDGDSSTEQIDQTDNAAAAASSSQQQPAGASPSTKPSTASPATPSTGGSGGERGPVKIGIQHANDLKIRLLQFLVGELWPHVKVDLPDESAPSTKGSGGHDNNNGEDNRMGGDEAHLEENASKQTNATVTSTKSTKDKGVRIISNSDIEAFLYLKNGAHGTKYVKCVIRAVKNKVFFDTLMPAREAQRWEERRLHIRMLDNLESKKVIESYTDYVHRFQQACNMALQIQAWWEGCRGATLQGISEGNNDLRADWARLSRLSQELYRNYLDACPPSSTSDDHHGDHDVVEILEGGGGEGEGMLEVSTSSLSYCSGDDEGVDGDYDEGFLHILQETEDARRQAVATFARLRALQALWGALAQDRICVKVYQCHVAFAGGGLAPPPPQTPAMGPSNSSFISPESPALRATPATSPTTHPDDTNTVLSPSSSSAQQLPSAVMMGGLSQLTLPQRQLLGATPPLAPLASPVTPQQGTWDSAGGGSGGVAGGGDAFSYIPPETAQADSAPPYQHSFDHYVKKSTTIPQPTGASQSAPVQNETQRNYRSFQLMQRPESTTLDYKSYFTNPVEEITDRGVAFICGFLNSGYAKGRLMIGVHEVQRSSLPRGIWSRATPPPIIRVGDRRTIEMSRLKALLMTMHTSGGGGAGDKQSIVTHNDEVEQVVVGVSVQRNQLLSLQTSLSQQLAACVPPIAPSMVLLELKPVVYQRFECLTIRSDPQKEGDEVSEIKTKKKSARKDVMVMTQSTSLPFPVSILAFYTLPAPPQPSAEVVARLKKERSKWRGNKKKKSTSSSLAAPVLDEHGNIIMPANAEEEDSGTTFDTPSQSISEQPGGMDDTNEVIEPPTGIYKRICKGMGPTAADGDSGEGGDSASNEGGGNYLEDTFRQKTNLALRCLLRDGQSLAPMQFDDYPVVLDYIKELGINAPPPHLRAAAASGMSALEAQASPLPPPPPYGNRMSKSRATEAEATQQQQSGDGPLTATTTSSSSASRTPSSTKGGGGKGGGSKHTHSATPPIPLTNTPTVGYADYLELLAVVPHPNLSHESIRDTIDPKWMQSLAFQLNKISGNASGAAAGTTGGRDRGKWDPAMAAHDKELSSKKPLHYTIITITEEEYNSRLLSRKMAEMEMRQQQEEEEAAAADTTFTGEEGAAEEQQQEQRVVVEGMGTGAASSSGTTPSFVGADDAFPAPPPLRQSTLIPTPPPQPSTASAAFIRQLTSGEVPTSGLAVPDPDAGGDGGGMGEAYASSEIFIYPMPSSSSSATGSRIPRSTGNEPATNVTPPSALQVNEGADVEDEGPPPTSPTSITDCNKNNNTAAGNADEDDDITATQNNQKYTTSSSLAVDRDNFDFPIVKAENVENYLLKRNTFRFPPLYLLELSVDRRRVHTLGSLIETSSMATAVATEAVSITDSLLPALARKYLSLSKVPAPSAANHATLGSPVVSSGEVEGGGDPLPPLPPSNFTELLDSNKKRKGNAQQSSSSSTSSSAHFTEINAEEEERECSFNEDEEAATSTTPLLSVSSPLTPAPHHHGPNFDKQETVEYLGNSNDSGDKGVGVVPVDKSPIPAPRTLPHLIRDFLFIRTTTLNPKTPQLSNDDNDFGMVSSNRAIDDEEDEEDDAEDEDAKCKAMAEACAANFTEEEQIRLAQAAFEQQEEDVLAVRSQVLKALHTYFHNVYLDGFPYPPNTSDSHHTQSTAASSSAASYHHHHSDPASNRTQQQQGRPPLPEAPYAKAPLNYFTDWPTIPIWSLTPTVSSEQYRQLVNTKKASKEGDDGGGDNEDANMVSPPDLIGQFAVVPRSLQSRLDEFLTGVPRDYELFLSVDHNPDEAIRDKRRRYAVLPDRALLLVCQFLQGSHRAATVGINNNIPSSPEGSGGGDGGRNLQPTKPTRMVPVRRTGAGGGSTHSGSSGGAAHIRRHVQRRAAAASSRAIQPPSLVSVRTSPFPSSAVRALRATCKRFCYLITLQFGFDLVSSICDRRGLGGLAISAAGGGRQLMLNAGGGPATTAALTSSAPSNLNYHPSLGGAQSLQPSYRRNFQPYNQQGGGFLNTGGGGDMFGGGGAAAGCPQIFGSIAYVQRTLCGARCSVLPLLLAWIIEKVGALPAPYPYRGVTPFDLLTIQREMMQTGEGDLLLDRELVASATTPFSNTGGPGTGGGQKTRAARLLRKQVGSAGGGVGVVEMEGLGGMEVAPFWRKLVPLYIPADNSHLIVLDMACGLVRRVWWEESVVIRRVVEPTPTQQNPPYRMDASNVDNSNTLGGGGPSGSLRGDDGPSSMMPFGALPQTPTNQIAPPLLPNPSHHHRGSFEDVSELHHQHSATFYHNKSLNSLDDLGDYNLYLLPSHPPSPAAGGNNHHRRAFPSPSGSILLHRPSSMRNIAEAGAEGNQQHQRPRRRTSITNSTSTSPAPQQHYNHLSTTSNVYNNNDPHNQPHFPRMESGLVPPPSSGMGSHMHSNISNNPARGGGTEVGGEAPHNERIGAVIVENVRTTHSAFVSSVTPDGAALVNKTAILAVLDVWRVAVDQVLLAAVKEILLDAIGEELYDTVTDALPLPTSSTNQSSSGTTTTTSITTTARSSKTNQTSSTMTTRRAVMVCGIESAVSGVESEEGNARASTSYTSPTNADAKKKQQLRQFPVQRLIVRLRRLFAEHTSRAYLLQCQLLLTAMESDLLDMGGRILPHTPSSPITSAVPSKRSTTTMTSPVGVEGSSTISCLHIGRVPSTSSASLLCDNLTNALMSKPSSQLQPTTSSTPTTTSSSSRNAALTPQPLSSSMIISRKKGGVGEGVGSASPTTNNNNNVSAFGGASSLEALIPTSPFRLIRTNTTSQLLSPPSSTNPAAEVQQQKRKQQQNNSHPSAAEFKSVRNAVQRELYQALHIRSDAEDEDPLREIQAAAAAAAAISSSAASFLVPTRTSLQHTFIFHTHRGPSSTATDAGGTTVVSASGSPYPTTHAGTTSQPHTSSTGGITSSRPMSLFDLLRWLSNCSALLTSSRASAATATVGGDAHPTKKGLGGNNDNLPSRNRNAPSSNSLDSQDNSSESEGWRPVVAARPLATLEAVHNGTVTGASLGLVLHADASNKQPPTEGSIHLIPVGHPLHGKLCATHLHSMITQRHAQVWRDKRLTTLSTTASVSASAPPSDFITHIKHAQKRLLAHVADVVVFACEHGESTSSESSYSPTDDASPHSSFIQGVRNLCGTSSAITTRAVLSHLTNTVPLSPMTPGSAAIGATFDADFINMLDEVEECTCSNAACVIDGWSRWLQQP